MKVRELLCLLLASLLILSLSACGGSSASREDMYASAEAPAMDMEMSVENGLSKWEDASTQTALPADRKLIRTIAINAETEDLTALLESLTERIDQLGGYVESKNLRNGSTYSSYRTRSLSMTVRIPAENADAFIDQVSDQANIVSSTESVDDVTLQYVDTESQVKALETEQERLLALLEQANTLEEILKIEDRMTEVRYQLERYASQLRALENQVSYATVNLSVTEVTEYTPVQEQSTWERITEGFGDTLEEIGDSFTEGMIWIIVNSPRLVIWGLILGVIVVVIRKRRTHKQKKTIQPPAKEETE